MRRYYYGLKVQLLINKKGMPINFVFLPARVHDARGFEQLLETLPPEAKVYADAAYNSYKIEDRLLEKHLIQLKAQRKSNSKRQDSKQQAKLKSSMRKKVETHISNISKYQPKSIHATSTKGFILKVALFIYAYQVQKFLGL